jgi:hypothetical protein
MMRWTPDQNHMQRHYTIKEIKQNLTKKGVRSSASAT